MLNKKKNLLNLFYNIFDLFFVANVKRNINIAHIIFDWKKEGMYQSTHYLFNTWHTWLNFGPSTIYNTEYL